MSDTPNNINTTEFKQNSLGIVLQEPDSEQAKYLEERAAKREKVRKRKRLQARLKIAGVIVGIVIILAALVCGIILGIKKINQIKTDKEILKQQEITASVPQKEDIPEVEDPEEEIEEIAEEPVQEEIVDLAANLGPYAEVYSDEKEIFFEGYKTGNIGGAACPSEDSVYSNYALLVDASTGQILVSKMSDTRINPASMTKIMTILVAAEHVDDLAKPVTIDREIVEYVWKNDCSAVNFSLDEVVTVEDVMYGTILPSGADAALALAKYIAGSEEAFVELMNDKLKELGLSDTAHFTNCTGIYNENHYCTLNDMAMIMKAAVENDLAKKILTAHKYTTSSTVEHEDGIEISNWFLRRIEDKDTHGEVICAKTGFVNESGCCAASYEKSNSGGYYICVTADTWSSWRCIYDHVAIYETYVE